MELSSEEIKFIKKNKKYFLTHKRPYDIDNALLYPSCDFVIIWENFNNKCYFHSPCQITQCIGGIEIGTNNTPKYTKCYTSCPLCHHCGDLNKEKIYHQHGKTKDNTILTLFRCGYDETGYHNANKIATKIEKCLMKTILMNGDDSDSILVDTLILKINKLKYYPFTSLRYYINKIDEIEKEKRQIKINKCNKTLKQINDFKIINIKNDMEKYIRWPCYPGACTAGSPGYYIIKELLTWYETLDQTLDTRYIWDLSQIWKEYYNDFYQKLRQYNIPKDHYLLYRTEGKILVPIMKDYPLYRNKEVHLKSSHILYYHLLKNKLFCIWILKKNISNDLIRLIFSYFSKIEFFD